MMDQWTTAAGNKLKVVELKSIPETARLDDVSPFDNGVSENNSQIDPRTEF